MAYYVLYYYVLVIDYVLVETGQNFRALMYSKKVEATLLKDKKFSLACAKICSIGTIAKKMESFQNYLVSR